MDPQEFQNTDSQVIPQPENHYFKTAKKMLKVALIIGGVILILVVILLIISGGDFNEGTGKGAIWWLLVPAAPFMQAVPILLILSMVYAILGIRDKKKTSQGNNKSNPPMVK